MMNVIKKAIQDVTKQDPRVFMQGGLWLFLAQTIASLTGFVVTTILANTLSQETFGEYRFMLAIVGVLLIFTLPGIETALTRSIAQGKKIQPGKILRQKIGWGMVGSLVGLVGVLYYVLTGNTTMAILMIATSCALPFFYSFWLYSAYYRGKEDFKTSSIYDSIVRIVQAALVIMVGVTTKNTLLMLSAYFIGNAGAQLVLYRKTIRKKEPQLIGKNEKDSEDATEEVIHYGKRLTYASSIGTFASYMDKILVGGLLGKASVAIYHIALTFPLTAVMFLNVVSRALLPAFSKSNWGTKEKKKILKGIGVFAMVLALGVLIYQFIVQPALYLFFPEYSESLQSARILGFLILTSPINAVIEQILRATQSVRYIVIRRVVYVASMAGVLVLAYQAIGIQAAACAVVMSDMVMLVIGLVRVVTLEGFIEEDHDRKNTSPQNNDPS